MMKPLTQNMMKALCDLHEATDGMIDVAYPLKAHWKVIEGLHDRKLINRDAQIENGKVVRYAALTELGQQWSCEHMGLGINADVVTPDRPRKCVAMFFEMSREADRAAYEYVGQLKSERNFRPTVIELLNIDEELERGETGLLEELYPEAMQALKQKIRQHLEMEYFEKIMSRLDTMNAPQAHETAPKQGVAPPKGLTPIAGVKSLDVPVFDDDDGSELVVQKDAAAGDVAVNNFLSSISKLQDN